MVCDKALGIWRGWKVAKDGDIERK